MYAYSALSMTVIWVTLQGVSNAQHLAIMKFHALKASTSKFSNERVCCEFLASVCSASLIPTAQILIIARLLSLSAAVYVAHYLLRKYFKMFEIWNFSWLSALFCLSILKSN